MMFRLLTLSNKSFDEETVNYIVICVRCPASHSTNVNFFALHCLRKMSKLPVQECLALLEEIAAQCRCCLSAQLATTLPMH